jgi:hypothetical protein
MADTRSPTVCRVSRFVELDNLELQGGASAIDRQHIHRRHNAFTSSISKNDRKPKAPIMTQSSIGNRAILNTGAAAGIVRTAI